MHNSKEIVTALIILYISIIQMGIQLRLFNTFSSIYIFCTLAYTCHSSFISSHNFPPGFKFGAATSAHQIEGGWNASDKSSSIWDTFGHKNLKNTADVSCDSYHNWREDVKVAKKLGLDFYRFSVSWTRILPSGFSNHVSGDGTRYYNNLIDALLENDIEPVITLYHWDLPQTLQDLGGWANPIISDWFADYSRVVYSLYSDRVKTFLTINEPLIFCEMGYTAGIHAPEIISPGFGDYLCAKHSLIAHAKAWRIYDKHFKPQYHGRVSILNQLLWFQAEEKHQEYLTEITRQISIGIYNHAIYSKIGGWPPVLEKHIAKLNKEHGLSNFKLPVFTAEEIKLVRGTYDFFGLNYYTSRLVRKAKDDEIIGPRPLCGIPELGIVMTTRPEWYINHEWFYIYPRGLRKLLNWIKKEYGDIEIIIMENGLIKRDCSLHDPDRVKFFKDHLEQILLAIHEDGINVTAYTAWAMLDNFEWTDSYDYSFGLHYVDFKDPLRRRVPRTSAHYFAHIIKNRSVTIPDFYKHYEKNESTALATILFIYLPIVRFLDIV